MFRIKPEPSVRKDSLWLMERFENQYCALDNCSQSFAKAGDKVKWEMEEWGRAVWHGRVKSASLWLLVICSMRLGTGWLLTTLYQSPPSVQKLRAAEKVKRDTHRGVMQFFLRAPVEGSLFSLGEIRHD